MSSVIHPWWYGGKTPDKPNIIEQYRGALLRIASGDAGDWKCNCPAHEIAQAALDVIHTIPPAGPSTDEPDREK